MQFESDYQYSYRNYANYRLPKWFGKARDTAQMMKDAADRRTDWMATAVICSASKIATNVVQHGNSDVPVSEFHCRM